VRAVVAERIPGGDDVLADLITLRAERAFAARLAMGGAAMRDGARTFLERTAGRTRLAAVTRARRDDAEAMLRLAGVTDLFTVVATADDVFDPKPSPASYALALDRLGKQRGTSIAPNAALAVEDGAAGCRAAHAARLRCVAVGPLPAHLALEADAYVDSLAGHSVRTLDELSRGRQEHVE
jgi:HAD superfamily hydrolase (TIGR01509 family)